MLDDPSGFRIPKLRLPDGTEVDVALRPLRLLKAGARFVAAEGRTERLVAPPTRRWWVGTVDGVKGAARWSAADDQLSGWLRRGGEWFRVESGLRRQGDGPIVEIEVQSMDLRPGRDGLAAACEGATGEPVPLRLADGLQPQAGFDRGPAGRTLIVPIAVDATVDWFQRFASLDDAQNYILDLMADVSVFMQAQIDVQIEVPFVRVFTAEPDPYTDGSIDTALLLSEVQAEWNTNQTAVERAAVHLLSFRNLGAAGRAFIDRLCDNDLQPGSSADYAVTLIPIISNPFEGFLVAHEIAHNIGSPHTQCYEPPIDTCATETGCYDGPTSPVVGTLMSNCMQFNPEFHPRVQEETLRPGVEAAAGLCVSTLDAPGRIEGSGAAAVQVEPDPLSPGQFRLRWGEPCNGASVPGQDFAVYRGALGNYGSYNPATCSTSGGTWTIPSTPGDRFFLVVPVDGSTEGSYGVDGSGNERLPSANACQSTQRLDACP